jgi:hypothetical protein
MIPLINLWGAENSHGKMEFYHRWPDHQKLSANPPIKTSHPAGFPATMKNAPTRIAAAGPVPALKFGNILVSPPEGVLYRTNI